MGKLKSKVFVGVAGLAGVYLNMFLCDFAVLMGFLNFVFVFT